MIEFWRAVEERLGSSLGHEERAYLQARQRVQWYAEAREGEPEDIDDVVDAAVADVKALREACLTGTSAAAAFTDSRWKLLEDLEADAFPEVRPRPILRVSLSRPVGFYTGQGPPPLSQEVAVIFDNRLAYRTLARLLRGMWPGLKSQGLIRQTRPLDERKAALLRFVCLETRQESWGARFARWNKKYSHWAYATRQAFITAVHDGEQSLTGERHGLAWFYDAKARLSDRDLQALAQQGDEGAKRELRRRRRAGIEDIEKAGIKFTRVTEGGRRGQAS